MSTCKRVTRKYCGGEFRSHTSKCLMVFGVPLLIPGVTMTVVAFYDETGFSRYSSLHVLGMVILALSIFFLLTGIFLSLDFKSRQQVAPEDAHYVFSSHDVSHKRPAMETVAMERVAPADDSSRSPESDKSPNGASPISDSLPVNFLREGSSLGHPTKAQAPSQHLGLISSSGSQASPQLDQTDETSSSEDSDSDDRSSGSYILIDNSSENRLSLLKKNTLNNNNACEISLHSKSKINSNTEANFEKLKDILMDKARSNNFFQEFPATSDLKLKDNIVLDTRRDSSSVSSVSKLKDCTFINQQAATAPESTKNLGTSIHTNVTVDGAAVQADIPYQSADQFSNKTSVETSSNHTSEIQPDSSSLRPRLHGLSSVALLTPSPSADNPTSFTDSRDTIADQERYHTDRQSAASGENLARSFASVFSMEKDSKTKSVKLLSDLPLTNSGSLVSLKLNHRRPLHQSPYASRPFSFPSTGSRHMNSANGSSRNQQASQRTMPRNYSPEASRCSDKSLVSPTSRDFILSELVT